MMRKVELSIPAIRDLERLAAFLRQANAPAASDKAMRALTLALRTLETLSERGRPGVKGLRELVVPFGRRAYIIEYQVRPEKVLVTRIFHSLEDRSNT